MLDGHITLGLGYYYILSLGLGFLYLGLGFLYLGLL